MPRVKHRHSLTFSLPPPREEGAAPLAVVGSCLCGARFRTLADGRPRRSSVRAPGHVLLARGLPFVYDDAFDLIAVERARLRCAECGHTRRLHGDYRRDGKVSCGADGCACATFEGAT